MTDSIREAIIDIIQERIADNERRAVSLKDQILRSLAAEDRDQTAYYIDKYNRILHVLSELRDIAMRISLVGYNFDQEK